MPPKPTCLSSNEAIDLIGKYLAKEWKYLKPEDVDVVRMQLVSTEGKQLLC